MGIDNSLSNTEPFGTDGRRLWTGRSQPIDLQHADHGVLRGFLPDGREARGTCEIHGRTTNLWAVAAPTLGLRVRAYHGCDALFGEDLLKLDLDLRS